MTCSSVRLEIRGHVLRPFDKLQKIKQISRLDLKFRGRLLCINQTIGRSSQSRHQHAKANQSREILCGPASEGAGSRAVLRNHLRQHLSSDCQFHTSLPPETSHSFRRRSADRQCSANRSTTACHLAVSLTLLPSTRARLSNFELTFKLARPVASTLMAKRTRLFSLRN